MPDRYSRIFLLSHMRAYTSLAAHILGSHPQINGYFELHISYDDASALDRQLEDFRGQEALKQNSRYLFDKLLHDDYLLEPEKLGISNIVILVSLLEPAQTIRSIVNLFAQKETEERYASPVEATNYYVNRLSELADYCQRSTWPYYYYDAELFKRDPERLLAKLTAWLDLDSPLSDQYQVFSQTGKARKGDSSRHIHSGKIHRTKTDYSHIALPENELNKAQAVYTQCRQRILGNAADAVTQ